jgi:GWxTD domain-containing protein
MKRFVLSICLLALLIAPGAGARELVGRGDFDFYLDTTAFRGRDGRVLAEVNVRIPNNEIKFIEDDGAFAARVRLSVLISDLEGEPVVQDAGEMRFTEPTAEQAKQSLHFQTIIKRYHLDPGVYLLSYAVEDLEAPKLTVVGMMRDKVATSTIRDVRFVLPDMPADVPSFSDAKFVWDVEPSDDPGRMEYHPNPQRMYGLYKDTLMVYMELYLPDEMANAPTFEFQTLIVDAGGNEVRSSAVKLPNPGPGVAAASGASGEGSMRTYPILLREDLTRFTAGTYTLRVSFFLDGRPLDRINAGSFSVAWDLRTWEVPRRELMAEARFLLGDEQFSDFQKRSSGEQEKMIDKLWKEADPTPETSENEAYQTFLERLAFVDEHYSDSGPAVFDPRGQLYMRLGPPDEIIQDVIPLNRETVSEALKMIEDQYHAVSFSTHGVKAYGTARRSHTVDPRGLSDERPGDNVAYPFELWVYDTAGKPLFERDQVQEIGIGTRYLFIDREGYGRYKLESSSSISTK